MKPKKTSNRVLTPEGAHPARIVKIIDFGIQQNKGYDGEMEDTHQVKVTFELPEELHTFDEDKGPQPKWESPFPYKFSYHKKAKLTQHFKPIAGKDWDDDFDIENLLGKECLVTIEHKVSDGDTYSNIVAVSAVPSGMKVKDLENDPIYYSIEEHGFEGDVWDMLSDWEQEKILKSQEAQEDE